MFWVKVLLCKVSKHKFPAIFFCAATSSLGLRWPALVLGGSQKLIVSDSALRRGVMSRLTILVMS